jgi:hypothetical protein
MIPCCCLSFFLTLFFVKGTSLKREDDAKLQEEGKEWAAKHRTRDRLNFASKKASKQPSESQKKDIMEEITRSGGETSKEGFLVKEKS